MILRPAQPPHRDHPPIPRGRGLLAERCATGRLPRAAAVRHHPARTTRGCRSNGPGTAAGLCRRYLSARCPSTHHAGLRRPRSSPRPPHATGRVRPLFHGRRHLGRQPPGRAPRTQRSPCCRHPGVPDSPRRQLRRSRLLPHGGAPGTAPGKPGPVADPPGEPPEAGGALAQWMQVGARRPCRTEVPRTKR
jgi:hypothetical protein